MIVSIVLSLPSESLPIFFSFSSLTIIYESESLVTFFVLKPHGSRNLTGTTCYESNPVAFVPDCICFWEVLNNRTLELLRTMFHNHNRIKTRRCTTHQNEIIKRKLYQFFCKTYPNSKNEKKSQD